MKEEEAESATKVIVDESRCESVAEVLRSIEIVGATEDHSLDSVPRVILPDFYFVLVAICHQTSPIDAPPLSGVAKDGRAYTGWDYLRRRLADRVEVDNGIVSIPWLLQCKASDLERLFEDEKGARTLSDASGRAALLRQLAETLRTLGIRSASEFMGLSDGWLEQASGSGLYDILGQFEAYSDPVKKKSCFFLELMRIECQWRYRDPVHLGPPVDYHEVRGHLRLGTVKICDPNLLRKVSEKQNVTAEEDIAIRQAVYDAIFAIAEKHGKAQPSVLHYLFWNLFRNCCLRDTPHCQDCGKVCRLPSRYRDAFRVHRCLFQAICPSATVSSRLVEHQHVTTYY